MSDSKKMALGDFTSLAENYSKYRPRYAPQVLDWILHSAHPQNKPTAVDLGAGTGILSRMLCEQGCPHVEAVEPNEAMRTFGIKDSKGFPITWHEGSGEKTPLKGENYELVTAASCFHWFDFQKATQEIQRLLKLGGIFCALWNTRMLEVSPLLAEIEETLYTMCPNIKRVSSGRSSFTDTLYSQLQDSSYFKDVVYLEGRHIQWFTKEAYLGVWSSVNDIQAQAGPEHFSKFMDFVKERISSEDQIEATYLTRAWCAQRKD